MYIQRRSARYYETNIASNILGYISEVNNSDIKNDSYYMKLCGSGGGGFFLAYDFDNQINSSFSDFKIYQI